MENKIKNRISDLIDSSGKSTREIAKELENLGVKIPYTTLLSYYKKTATPKIDNQKIIANYFGVSVTYLMGLREEFNLKEIIGIVEDFLNSQYEIDRNVNNHFVEIMESGRTPQDWVEELPKEYIRSKKSQIELNCAESVASLLTLVHYFTSNDEVDVNIPWRFEKMLTNLTRLAMNETKLGITSKEYNPLNAKSITDFDKYTDNSKHLRHLFSECFINFINSTKPKMPKPYKSTIPLNEMQRKVIKKNKK